MNHNHEDDNDAGEPGGFWVGLLAGLLIGGLAGAVAMLLLAPQSGKKDTGQAPTAKPQTAQADGRNRGRRGGAGPRHSPPDHARCTQAGQRTGAPRSGDARRAKGYLATIVEAGKNAVQSHRAR